MTLYDVKGSRLRRKDRLIRTERQKDFLQELMELEGVKELRHEFDGGGYDGKTDL